MSTPHELLQSLAFNSLKHDPCELFSHHLHYTEVQSVDNLLPLW